MTRAFGVDPERFLLLVTAIASLGCTDGRRGDEVAVQPEERTPSTPRPELEPPALESPAFDPPARDPPARDPPALEPPALEPERTHPQEVEPGPEAAEEVASCDNDVGIVDCTAVARLDRGGPACEGTTGACELLARGYAYKPRVAQEIAACWGRLGRDVCDNRKRGRCNEKALRHACPDPRFESQCTEIIERCKAAGARIDFSQDTCVRALSGMVGAELDWAARSMGPAHEGKGPQRCRLRYPIW